MPDIASAFESIMGLIFQFQTAKPIIAISTTYCTHIIRYAAQTPQCVSCRGVEKLDRCTLFRWRHIGRAHIPYMFSTSTTVALSRESGMRSHKYLSYTVIARCGFRLPGATPAFVSHSDLTQNITAFARSTKTTYTRSPTLRVAIAGNPLSSNDRLAPVLTSQVGESSSA